MSYLIAIVGPRITSWCSVDMTLRPDLTPLEHARYIIWGKIYAEYIHSEYPDCHNPARYDIYDDHPHPHCGGKIVESHWSSST